MLSVRNRFHGHGSLNYLYKNGTSVRSHWMVFKYIKNPRRKNPRISVVISKKIHKSAVGRNRIRRRIYEIFRAELPKFNDSFDMTIIIVSGETLGLNADELYKAVTALIDQTPVYRDI